MATYVFEHLHQPDGWLSPARLEVDPQGFITTIESFTPETSSTMIRGYALPGMSNLHSHAFQRAIVGLTEAASQSHQDSFWTWRNKMYQAALNLTPEDLEAIAAQLYVEMLEAGMTAVGEFHYLHHDLSGNSYDDIGEMSRRIFAAAELTGISLTHLPVLYLHGGFDCPAKPEQRRFVHSSVDKFMRLVDCLRSDVDQRKGWNLGIAPHSLRAVDAAALNEVIESIGSEDLIHIHVAEQTQEVEEAVNELGSRPVQWLLDHHDVNHRWCLIHATHLDNSEINTLAQTQAVVGLCPTTEANLGDGIFPAEVYLEAGGRFGIGSDSHVCINVAEELRLLEYGQRLREQRRNVLASASQVHVGRRLFDAAIEGGACALQQPSNGLVVGQRADVVVLDNMHPRLLGHDESTIIDAWIFGGGEKLVSKVMVGGKWQVEEGRHCRAEEIRSRFGSVLQRLRGTV